MVRGVRVILILTLFLSHLPFANASIVENMYNKITNRNLVPLDISTLDRCVKAITLARETHIYWGETTATTISGLISYTAALHALSKYRKELDRREEEVFGLNRGYNAASGTVSGLKKTLSEGGYPLDHASKDYVLKLLENFKDEGKEFMGKELFKELEELINTIRHPGSSNQIKNLHLINFLNRIETLRESSSGPLFVRHYRVLQGKRLADRRMLFGPLAGISGAFFAYEAINFFFSRPPPDGSTLDEEYAKEDQVFNNQVSPNVICRKVGHTPELKLLLQRARAVERENQRPGTMLGPGKMSPPASPPVK